MAANLLAVLLAGALLGVELWVVAVWILARVVAEHDPTPGFLLKTGVTLVLSAFAWVAAVALLVVVVNG